MSPNEKTHPIIINKLVKKYEGDVIGVVIYHHVSEFNG